MTERGEIIFNNFDRMVYADKHQIPLFTTVYEKEEDKISLGKNFIQNNEYWGKKQKIFDLYQLVKKYPIAQIVDKYIVDTLDVMMVYYETFGATDILKNFVENTLMQYFSEESMEQRYKNWKLNATENIKYTGIVKRNTEKLQTWLHNAKKRMEFKTSPIEIISASLEGDVQLKVSDQSNNIKYIPVDISIGLDIFLQSFVSFQVPFISYKGNADSEVKIKVFEGDIPISLDKIKPSDSQIETPHSMYITVWNDKVTTSKANLESYVNVFIDLKEKRATFFSKMTELNTENGKPLLLNRLVKNMPLRIVGLKETNLLGEFKIYGLELNNSLFLDFIMNNPLASQIIYMNETSTSFATKKRINYHLRETELDFNNTPNLWRKYFSFLLHQEYPSKAEDKPIVNYFFDGVKDNMETNNAAKKKTKGNKKDGGKQKETNKGDTGEDGGENPNKAKNNKAVALTKNTPYLTVSINQSENRQTLQLGLLIFTSMIGIFKEREAGLQEIYQKLGVKFSIKPIKLTIVESKKINIEGNEYIYDLQNAAPHIFENNYKSLICQKVIQPIIIPPSLQDEWDEKHEDPYQKAIPFPPDAPENEQILLGCPAEKTPFISMKENTLVNQEEFPFLPCCTAKNTQLPDSHSLFTHYYLGEPLLEDKKATVNEINSRKRLVKEQVGNLPFSIQSTFSLLGIVSPHEKESVKRFGVGHSPLSAVRCVLWAMNDERFMKLNQKKESLENELAIESYIKELIKHSISRKNKRVWETALSQEVFGYDVEEIHTMLREIEYFDSKLFYRWMEIFFDVHVFVFSVSKAQEIEFEIPNHKIFHARPYLDLPCIILFKHWGSENDMIDFPQYEIIFYSQLRKGVKKMTWDKNVSKQLIDFAHQIQTVYQFDKKNNQLRENPYSLHYMRTIFPNAKTQYVDGAGKLRGITISLDDTKEDERVTIYTPPSQPLNLDIEYSEYSVDLNTALQLFDDKPTYYSLEQGKVNGIWFPIYDISMGVYVPLIEMEKKEFDRIFKEQKIPMIQEGRENPYYVYGESILENYHNVEKMRNVFLQAILWVFLIYTKQEYDMKKIASFLKKYVTVRKFNFKRELSSINTTLPFYTNVNDALAYLENFFPFVQESQFLCVNQEMWEKIEYFLTITVERQNKQQDLVQERVRENPDYIDPSVDIHSLYTLYSSSDDFPRMHSMQVFLNLHNFKMWMYNKLYGRGDKIEIIEKMTISNSTYKNPFIYMQHTSKQIFLIQNVSLGEEKRAMSNYLNYIEKGVNLGYFTPISQQDMSKLPKIVYIVAPSGDLVLDLNLGVDGNKGVGVDGNKKVGNVENDENIIHLLRYTNNIYAAVYKLT